MLKIVGIHGILIDVEWISDDKISVEDCSTHYVDGRTKTITFTELQKELDKFQYRVDCVIRKCNKMAKKLRVKQPTFFDAILDAAIWKDKD